MLLLSLQWNWIGHDHVTDTETYTVAYAVIANTSKHNIVVHGTQDFIATAVSRCDSVSNR